MARKVLGLLKYFLNKCKEMYSQYDGVLFKIIKTKQLTKISLKDRQVNETVSGEIVTRMIFSVLYMIKQLLIQIMCKT